MEHVRPHVRTSALKSGARILDGIPGVKAVRVSRRYPYEGVALPAIDLSWVQEEVAEVKAGVPGRRLVDREMILRARVVGTDADDTPDDPIEFRIDAILLEIERRFNANQQLPDENGVPTVRRVRLIRSASDSSEKGTTAFIASALFFKVTASHREGRPDNTLPQQA